MLKPELRTVLLELKQQLDSKTADSPTDRERMESLSSQVDHILEHHSDPESQEPYDAVREQLRDSATYFEVSHPRLTGVINNVIQTLNRLGI